MSVGMPQNIWLYKFGEIVRDAFGDSPYHVGSSLKSKDWRDVDVRLMLDDDKFDAMFGRHASTVDAKLAAFTLAFAALGEKMTGLPIDFQIQRASDANERHNGQRSALIQYRGEQEGRD